MHGHSSHLLRWLRLFLACLTLVGSGASAQALPRPAPGSASLSGGSASTPRAPELVRYARHFLRPARPTPTVSAAPLAPVNSHTRRHPPGPTRRLFLLHASLLH